MIFLWIILAVVAAVTVLAVIGRITGTYRFRPEERNPMEGKRVRFVADENERENADGVRGHLEACGESEHKGSFYEIFVKRCADIVMSFFGIRHWRKYGVYVE